MEKSEKENTINETTGPTIDVNNEKENIEKDESSVQKIGTDLCELKQINCEIGAKVEIPENCSINSCNNEECKINEDENKSNPFKESREERNEDQCKLIKNDDEKNYNECCILDNNTDNTKKSCQSTSKSKETTTCTKQKRKSRSTRKRLNAMISNASMHFSDTDSEGELVIMEAYARTSSPVKLRQGPIISVTMEDIESVDKSDTNPQNLTISTTPDFNRSRCGSIAENLTDVDEIYGSEPENEQPDQPEDSRKSLTITEITYQAETDIEDLSNDEVEPVIYLTPRTDILCEFGGETITTKEGDGPFSVEIRNRMSKEIEETETQSSYDIMILPSTDTEDMEMSDDDLQYPSCSQRVLYDDLDILAASQIVMTNVNKSDNMLGFKDTQEDLNIADCHTDVEDVD